jgi:hypothetical protein
MIAETIQVVIHVPGNEDNDGTIRAFDQLPKHVQQHIRDAFQRHFTIENSGRYNEEDGTKHDLYAIMTSVNCRNAHADKNYCVNLRVVKKTAMASTHRIAKGDNLRACDACTKDHKPCVRVIRDNGMAKLCMYSRPVKERESLTWRDAEFWL